MTAREVLANYGMQAMISWPLPVLARHGFPSARALALAFVARVPMLTASDELAERALRVALETDPVIRSYVRVVMDLGMDLGVLRAGEEPRVSAWLLSLAREVPYQQADLRD